LLFFKKRKKKSKRFTHLEIHQTKCLKLNENEQKAEGTRRKTLDSSRVLLGRKTMAMMDRIRWKWGEKSKKKKTKINQILRSKFLLAGN